MNKRRMETNQRPEGQVDKYNLHTSNDELEIQVIINEALVNELKAKEKIIQDLRSELTQLKEEHQDQTSQEMEALLKQVEELKAQLQRAETLHHPQEEKMKQLSAKLERQAASVLEVRDERQDVLRESWTNISQTVTEVDVLLPQPEPKTRDEFLKYSREITLDPNTAHKQLLLTEGNRGATEMGQSQYYPRHPDRFTGLPQVLSRESLTGRCYWEVEWGGYAGVDVAVSYKSIRRDGGPHECAFGGDNKSWMLYCDPNSYTFIHNEISTDVSGPRYSRIGVYLDHDAGILSFYSVSEAMILLHRVQTTFTEPLHAGLSLYCGAYAEFC